MCVDIRRRLVVGVPHDLHGDQRIDAAFVEERHVVVPEVMRGQRGLDLLEDVVRAGGARLELPPFHAAAFQHQSRPHALVSCALGLTRCNQIGEFKPPTTAEDAYEGSSSVFVDSANAF